MLYIFRTVFIAAVFYLGFAIGNYYATTESTESARASATPVITPTSVPLPATPSVATVAPQFEPFHTARLNSPHYLVAWDTEIHCGADVSNEQVIRCMTQERFVEISATATVAAATAEAERRYR